MNDHDIPPMDADVRALVRSAAKVEPAPAGARERVLDRVVQVVGPPGGGGGGGEAGTSGAAGLSGTNPSRASLRFLRRSLPLVASFALGGGVVAVALHRAPEAKSFVEPGVRSFVGPSPADSLTGLSAEAEDVAALPTSGTAPSNPREVMPSLATASVEAKPPPSPSRDQLTAERRLLDLARGALEREEPQAALDATSQHERSYPNGALVQEREAMAIRALVLLHRASEARVRAVRFRGRFPQSLLLPTIESIVGAGRVP